VNDAKGIAFAVRPTPSRGPVSFTFTLASAEPVHLAVFDVSGRWVRELIRETRPAGRHDARWDGLDRSGAEAPAGLYLAVLRAGARAVSVRVPLLR
jgi:flagellar hook assembly protein FlgD